jgi:hypothetical protein
MHVVALEVLDQGDLEQLIVRQVSDGDWDREIRSDVATLEQEESGRESPSPDGHFVATGLDRVRSDQETLEDALRPDAFSQLLDFLENGAWVKSTRAQGGEGDRGRRGSGRELRDRDESIGVSLRERTRFVLL